MEVYGKACERYLMSKGGQVGGWWMSACQRQAPTRIREYRKLGKSRSRLLRTTGDSFLTRSLETFDCFNVVRVTKS